jgi:nicotinate-nucleotide pyrophosphorylase (carboxylating)
LDGVEVRKPPEALLRLARVALLEDVGRGDETSRITVPAGIRARARFVAREALVVSGLEAARAVFFEAADQEVSFAAFANEGDRLAAGSVLAEVEGPAQPILSAERVALNLLMRLSGVATLTSRYVEAVAGTGVGISDTRKTTPGLRLLEKAAVRAGGGTNHRAGLDDGILIKDNHLALAGGVTEAVRRAKGQASHLLKVEVEVESLEELEEAIRAGVDAVLLDNMTPEEVREAAGLARRERPELLVEVSGGVNLRTVRSYAEAGPDFISVGALTHSAAAADISLEVEPC